MKTTYSVTGMTYGKCATSVEQVISSIPEVQDVHVNFQTHKIENISSIGLSTSTLNDAVSKVGKYVVSDQLSKNYLSFYKKKIRVFLPLIIIFAIILIWTATHQAIQGFTLHNAMHDFMAGFFLIFGGLKILNWSNFAVGFRAYDQLARRSKTYAYL